jgi:hypothetical protein
VRRIFQSHLIILLNASLFFLSCTGIEHDNNIVYTSADASADSSPDTFQTTSVTAGNSERNDPFSSVVFNLPDIRKEANQEQDQKQSDDQNNSDSQNQNGTGSPEELIEKLTTGNIIQESDYDQNNIPDAKKLKLTSHSLSRNLKGRLSLTVFLHVWLS